VFYVHKNIAEDRYILVKPVAGDIVTKIQDFYLLPFISIFIYVFLTSYLKIFLFYDYSDELLTHLTVPPVIEFVQIINRRLYQLIRRIIYF